MMGLSQAVRCKHTGAARCNVPTCPTCHRAGTQVILGTQYAGEMKKGVFTVMHYFMPKQGILSLHSGCNVGGANDVSLFFGLSGVQLCLRMMYLTRGQRQCKGCVPEWLGDKLCRIILLVDSLTALLHSGRLSRPERAVVLLILRLCPLGWPSAYLTRLMISL